MPELSKSVQPEPPAKWYGKGAKTGTFFAAFDPSRQLHLPGEGGSNGEKRLESRVLLALHQMLTLAEGGRGVS